MPVLGTILTALVTPFHPEDEALDEQAFVGILGHVMATGSDGVVVCGSTGEAGTLTDTEHLRCIELALAERPPGATVVASTGSNDTRHAVALTEAATELGADAILSVTPYYVRPSRRGLVRHYEEVARATDRPILLYNIPTRTGLDVPNDWLAELAQIEGVDGVKQANPDNLALIDGLDLYAGNDDMLADTLEMGGVGGISVASHVAGPLIRRMVSEPDRRREIDAQLRPLFEALSVTVNPTPIKAALNLLGHRAGTLRLPLIDADERETEVVRAALSGLGLLGTAEPVHSH